MVQLQVQSGVRAEGRSLPRPLWMQSHDDPRLSEQFQVSILPWRWGLSSGQCARRRALLGPGPSSGQPHAGQMRYGTWGALAAQHSPLPAGIFSIIWVSIGLVTGPCLHEPRRPSAGPQTLALICAQGQGSPVQSMRGARSPTLSPAMHAFGVTPSSRGVSGCLCLSAQHGSGLGDHSATSMLVRERGESGH